MNYPLLALLLIVLNFSLFVEGIYFQYDIDNIGFNCVSQPLFNQSCTFSSAMKQLEIELKNYNETQLFVDLKLIIVEDVEQEGAIVLPLINKKQIVYNVVITSSQLRKVTVNDGICLTGEMKSLQLNNIILGCGIQQSTTIDFSASNSVFKRYITLNGEGSKVFIKNSKLFGNETRMIGLFITQAVVVEIVDCEFFENRIIIRGNNNLKSTLFKNCLFSKVDDSEFRLINDLKFENCQFIDIFITEPILIDSASTVTMSNCLFSNIFGENYLFSFNFLFDITFTNNTISNNQFSLFYAYNSLNLFMENNLFQNNTILNLNLIHTEKFRRLFLTNNQFFNNHAISENSSHFKIKDVTKVTGNTLYFENCTSLNEGGALSIYHSDFSIENSKFINNISYKKGGAIYSDKGYISISESLFKENKAIISGGAMHSESFIVKFIFESNFINNQVIPSSRSDKQVGLGGAIYIHSDNDVCNFDLQRQSLFTNNTAKYGGAIYFKGKCVKLGKVFKVSGRTIFTDNTALTAGGALYFSSSFDLNEKYEIYLNNFINNNAGVYGKIFASDIYQIDSTILKKSNIIVNYGQFDLYPGDKFSLQLIGFKDFFSNNITNVMEPISVAGNQTVDYSYNITTTLNNIYIDEMTPILREGTHFNYSQIISIQLETFKLDILYNLVSCPNEKEYQYIDSLQGFICVNKPNDTLLIVLVAIGGVLCFAFGIVLGGIIFYGIVNIIKRLNKLRTKEKAERDIEKKMMMIINEEESLDEPLIKKSSSSKQTLDIIIPVEDIKVINRIAEGGNGIIYYGYWKSTEVAIKSLKMVDSFQTKSFEQTSSLSDTLDTTTIGEFEKEASLLAKLRHPNIVNFYGVCITEHSKYMIVEYMRNGDLGKLIYYSKIELDGKESGRKVDVYSFAIIMWELLFEENPYCNQQSDKLYFFQTKKKENINALNVPFMVIKGERPKIPFQTDEQLNTFIELFVIPREKENDNLFILKEVIRKYVGLFKMCWSQNPTDRPEFNFIIDRLMEIKVLLK
ncbi:hypothetical protein ABK040_016180 [Willaertia magna]